MVNNNTARMLTLLQALQQELHAYSVEVKGTLYEVQARRCLAETDKMLTSFYRDYESVVGKEKCKTLVEASKDRALSFQTVFDAMLHVKPKDMPRLIEALEETFLRFMP